MCAVNEKERKKRREKEREREGSEENTRVVRVCRRVTSTEKM